MSVYVTEDIRPSLYTAAADYITGQRNFIYDTSAVVTGQRNFIYDTIADIKVATDITASLQTAESDDVVGPMSREFVYDTLIPVGPFQRNFIYDIVQEVACTRSFLYDSELRNVFEREFLYDTQGIITVDRGFLYDTRISVGPFQCDFIYDTSLVPTGGRNFIYDTHGIITVDRGFLYDTGISLGSERDFVYDALLNVARTNQFLYDTRLSLLGQRDFVYATRLGVLGTGPFIYDTKGVFVYTRRFIYDVTLALGRRAYFGGQVVVDGIVVKEMEKQILLRALGHAKELEQWPDYLISEETGVLFELPGVTLRGYTEPVGGALLGPKILSYKFKAGGSRQRKDNPINTITVKGASVDTAPGIRVISYDLWQNKFKWYEGAWTGLAADTSDQTITAGDGSILTVDVGKLPDQSCYGYVSIITAFVQESYTPSSLDGPGQLEFVFDNGRPVVYKYRFDQVVIYDLNVGDYTDETEDASISGRNSFTAFNQSGDYLYIGDFEPFSRVKFIRVSGPSALSMTIEYGQGYNSWKSLTYTDDTSDFTTDGDIYWTIPVDWRPSVVDMGSVGDFEGYYWIRIGVASITGSLSLYSVERPMVLQDAAGGELLLDVDVERLPFEDAKSDIILRENDAGTVVPCVWYQGRSVADALTDILDEARYGSNRRLVDTVKVKLGTVEY